ncbi:hypothetical protein HNY73_018879 [Argiope bruennichi]|uniref:Uncharacterized protein n=1 Tax=Argiope bruennichi TaxID=94029 RepID=A0A8T0EJD0_ARGBR|nr:hypothetical protein HNY73_018879 [Argiope bruennichi]
MRHRKNQPQSAADIAERPDRTDAANLSKHHNRSNKQPTGQPPNTIVDSDTVTENTGSRDQSGLSQTKKGQVSPP